MTTTEKPDASAAWDPKQLPAAGPGRFWRLERNPKNQTKPVKISLMQRYPGTKASSFASLVGFGQAPGIPEMIYEEAQTVLDIHGRVDEIVGEYGDEEAS
jgi:hypothetical protein